MATDLAPAVAPAADAASSWPSSRRPAKPKRYGTLQGKVFNVNRFSISAPNGEKYERCTVGLIPELPGLAAKYPENVRFRGDRVGADVVEGAYVTCTVTYANNPDENGKPYLDGLYAVRLAV